MYLYLVKERYLSLALVIKIVICVDFQSMPFYIDSTKNLVSFGIRAQFFCRQSPLSSSSAGAAPVYCQATRKACRSVHTRLPLIYHSHRPRPLWFLFDVTTVFHLLFCAAKASTVACLTESHTPNLFFCCYLSLEPMTHCRCRAFYFAWLEAPAVAHMIELHAPDLFFCCCLSHLTHV